MSKLLSSGEVADHLGVPPKTITDLLYHKRAALPGLLLIGGRRLVPRALVPKIETMLRDAGKLPAVVV